MAIYRYQSHRDSDYKFVYLPVVLQPHKHQLKPYFTIRLVLVMFFSHLVGAPSESITLEGRAKVHTKRPRYRTNALGPQWQQQWESLPCRVCLYIHMNEDLDSGAAFLVLQKCLKSPESSSGIPQIRQISAKVTRSLLGCSKIVTTKSLRLTE